MAIKSAGVEALKFLNVKKEKE